MLKIALIGTGIAVSMASALANIATAPAPAPKAAVAKAEAGNVLTLADGTTAMTWDEFAKALNTPQTVEGKIEDLPSDNASLLAYNKAMADTATVNQALRDAKADSAAVQTARGKVTAAATALSTAEQDTLTKYNELQGVLQNKANDTTALANDLAEMEAALATAKTNRQNYIDRLEANYNDSLTYYNYLRNDSVSHLNTTRGVVNNQLTAVKDSVSKYQKIIDSCDLALEKYGRTVQTSSLKPWLLTIYTAANNFKKDYDDLAQNSPARVYARTEEYGRGTSKKIRLILAFGTTAPNDGNEWGNAMDPDQYYVYVEGMTTVPTEICVYLGSEYSTLSGTGSVNLTVTSANATDDPDTILATAVSGLTTLTNSNIYQDNSSRTVYPGAANYPYAEDEDKVAIIKAYTETIPNRKTWAQGKKNDWEAKQTPLETRLTEIDNLITATQAHATLLNSTNVPAARNKWQTAQAAAENGTKTDDEEFNALNQAVTDAQGEVTTAQTKLTEAKGRIATAQKAFDDALVAYNNALEAKAKADADLNSEISAYDTKVATAQKTADDAAALVTSTKAAAQKAADEIATQNYQKNLQTITLTADVTVTTLIDPTYSGRINGNGYVFNCTTPAFDHFTGRVNNAAINGTFSNDYAEGKFVNVAVWTGTIGRYYDDLSTPTTGISTIGALGFAVRENFGVDFAAKRLAKLTATNKVYSIKVYNVNGNHGETPYFVNLVDGKFVNPTITSMGLTANTFVSSATDDEALADMANVLVQENGAWKCNNVVIEDAVADQSKAYVNFYAPFAISATKVTYKREFAKGYNAVCLPFALTPDEGQGLKYVLKYDTEKDGKFWFTAVGTGVGAYEPALVYTPQGGTSITFDNVDIVDTNGDQIYVGGTNKESNFTSHGTVKYILAGEFLGESEVDNVYGLVGDVFKKAGSGAHFSAFRMGIRSNSNTTPAMADAPRRIGVRDENGFEITDLMSGVESVAAEETSLSVATGVGEIVFTSEADYGKVEVYSIDGRIVAVADVMAGTSSVNVAKGVYIVMGKKVMVK